MTTERKLRWATNFFIWSSVAALVLIATAHFIGYMTGGLAAIGSPYVFALINGLVLRRYKSRVAAALFVLFGLIGFAVGMFLLLIGYVYVAVAPIVFFAAYVTIAVWTFNALTRLHGERSRPVLRRSDQLKTEKKRTDAYYLVIADAVSQLPLSDRTSRQPIARGRAGPGLLAHILFSKYGLHLPLNRQSATYAREGFDLDVSTLADWVGAAAATLMPLVLLIRTHVFAAERIHADDTTVRVLATGKTRTGRLWTYVRDDRPFGGPDPPAAAPPAREGGERQPVTIIVLVVAMFTDFRVGSNSVFRRCPRYVCFPPDSDSGHRAMSVLQSDIDSSQLLM